MFVRNTILLVSDTHLGPLVLLLLVVTLAALLLEGAALLQHDDAGVPQLARPAVTRVTLVRHVSRVPAPVAAPVDDAHALLPPEAGEAAVAGAPGLGGEGEAEQEEAARHGGQTHGRWRGLQHNTASIQNIYNRVVYRANVQTVVSCGLQ